MKAERSSLLFFISIMAVVAFLDVGEAKPKSATNESSQAAETRSQEQEADPTQTPSTQNDRISVDKAADIPASTPAEILQKIRPAPPANYLCAEGNCACVTMQSCVTMIATDKKCQEGSYTCTNNGCTCKDKQQASIEKKIKR